MESSVQLRLGFGSLLGETFGLVAQTWPMALALVGVLGGLAFAGEALDLVKPNDNLAGFEFGFMIDANDGLAASLFKLVSAVASVLASYFYLSHLLASRGALGEGGTRIWAYIGLSILSAIGIVLGFIALIVPGLLLMVRWSAASGFLLGEREEITDSLRASWDATRGQFWPIFAAGVVLIVGLIVLGSVAGGLSGLSGSSLAEAFAVGLVDGIGTLFPLAFGIAVYLLAHRPDERLDEVFA